jgi:hypothetical protein
LVFLFDAREGMEQELADIGEGDGVAGGDAVLGDGGEEFAEDEIDVGGGEEIAGNGGGNLGAKLVRFQELLLRACVKRTERRVIGAAEHAAAAAVGEGELAEMGFGFNCKRVVVVRIGAFSGHGSPLEVKLKGKEIKKQGSGIWPEVDRQRHARR